MKKFIKKGILFGSLSLMMLSGCGKKNDTTEDLGSYVVDQIESNYTKYHYSENINTNYTDLSYDETKTDEDIVNIPDDYKIFVLDELGKTSKDEIRVKDLKQLNKIVIPVTDEELSWLNYCTNLKVLKLEYCYKTDTTKYIKELPALQVLSVNSAASIPVEINDYEFSFIKDLYELDCKRNFDLDYDYLKQTNIKKMGLVPGGYVKVDYKKLDFLDILDVDILDELPYNSAIYFTDDVRKYLLSKGVDILAGRKVEAINKQLNEINDSLEINDRDFELAKYKTIAKYMVYHMHYGDIDENESTHTYYEGGILKGSLDEDEGAICANYAALTAALCARNNIECYIITSGDKGRHAWNIVKLNNKYYNSDITNVDHNYYQTPDGDILTPEEYITKYGVRDNVMSFLLFKDGDFDGQLFVPIYLPEEYKKYQEDHAVIELMPREGKSLNLKRV